jgi:2-hydroxy-6-oxonona-2,4-dienedioate hydrolase
MSLYHSEAVRASLAAWYPRFLARVPIPTTHRTLATRHGETHVLVAGPEDAPPLVVLHGALATSAHLLPEVAPLLRTRRVYAVDVLGQSTHSADHRPDVTGPAYPEWVSDVLDGLGLAHTALLGVSWGGFVASRAATTMPGRVDALVLVVPAGIIATPPLAALWGLGLPLAGWTLFRRRASLDALVAAVFTTPDPDWQAYMAEAFLAYKMDFSAPPPLTAAEAAGFAGPVLVFGATHDLSFPGDLLLARARALWPHAETERLVGVKHSPATDPASREALCTRIASFLDRVPASKVSP